VNCSTTYREENLNEGCFATSSRQANRLDSVPLAASVREVLDAASLVETDTREGLIVLDGPAPLLRDGAHFHAYLPWVIIDEAVGAGKLKETIEEDVFRASLEDHWGVLGLLAHRNQLWVFAPSRHRPFLKAASRSWSHLEAAGPRYTAHFLEAVVAGPLHK